MWILRCIKNINIPINGKRGRYTKDFNTQKYLVLLATECVVYPDLQNAKLQDFYKVKGVEQLLGKLLKPGEVGKNMYCIMHENEIIIIDAGVIFPDDMMGVDYIIPDFTFLKKFKNFLPFS